MILNQGGNLTTVNGKDYKALNMLMRYLEIYYFYGTMGNLERAHFTHPNVTYRHVISPSKYIPWNYIPLSLNETQVEEIFNQGVQDGLSATTSNKEMSKIDNHIEYYKLKKQGHASVKGKSLGEYINTYKTSKV